MIHAIIDMNSFVLPVQGIRSSSMSIPTISNQALQFHRSPPPKPPDLAGPGKAPAKQAATLSKPKDELHASAPPTAFSRAAGSLGAGVVTGARAAAATIRAQAATALPTTPLSEADRRLADGLLSQARHGGPSGAHEAAGQLATTLNQRTDAERRAIVAYMSESDPASFNQILRHTHVPRYDDRDRLGFQHLPEREIIGQTLGEVYEAKLAQDPTAAAAWLDRLVAPENNYEFGFYKPQLLTEVLRDSGSTALQTAAAERMLAVADSGVSPELANTYFRAAAETVRGLRGDFASALTRIVDAVQGNDYGFSLSDLRLSYLDSAGWTALRNALDGGSQTLDQTFDHIGTLQQYWGLDNTQMVSALREIYYPTLLDPFINNAGNVAAQTPVIGPAGSSQNGVTASQAALAQTLLFVAKQGQGYRDPILPIHAGTGRPGFPANEELGLDHLIAGLDGMIHGRTGTNSAVYDLGIRAFGGDPAALRSQDAVTWLGDLTATVRLGLGSPGTIAERAAAGYAQEMPLQDFNGDMMAFLAGRALNPQGHNLAEVLRQTYSPVAPGFVDRHREFGQAIGLQFDAAGHITNRQAFIDQHLASITALGRGLGGVGQLAQSDADARAIALINVNRFLDQIEAGAIAASTP